MYTSYTIEPVMPRTIDKTYPLVKVIAPGLLQREWRQLCQSCGSSSTQAGPAETERIVVALNAKGYVKGFCIYAIRDHATYGRVLDVPFFVTASVADGEGVASALIDYLRAQCDATVCSGIRFWTMSADTWSRRLKPEQIARTDHGLFMPALASAAEIKNALCARGIERCEVIDQLSR